MPIFRFHINVDVPPHVISQRLQTVVRESTVRNFFFPWQTASERARAPFLGTVQPNSFRIRRDVYRNAFTPHIWGRIAPTQSGARVSVTMFLNPLVMIFVLMIILGNMNASPGTRLLIAAVCIAFVVFGFFPDAIRAKRLITNTILEPTRMADQL